MGGGSKSTCQVDGKKGEDAPDPRPSRKRNAREDHDPRQNREETVAARREKDRLRQMRYFQRRKEQAEEGARREKVRLYQITCRQRRRDKVGGGAQGRKRSDSTRLVITGAREKGVGVRH